MAKLGSDFVTPPYVTQADLDQYRCRMRAWSAAAGTPWRRLAIVAANPRGAIYGTIVASAVIAAYAAGGKSPDVILTATVATLLVFWLAHVYAHFLDHEVRHDRTRWKVLASIMGQELSMLAAPALSILFLVLGALGVLNEPLAVRLALWTGVVQLFGWGMRGGPPNGGSSLASGVSYSPV